MENSVRQPCLHIMPISAGTTCFCLRFIGHHVTCRARMSNDAARQIGRRIGPPLWFSSGPDVLLARSLFGGRQEKDRSKGRKEGKEGGKDMGWTFSLETQKRCNRWSQIISIVRLDYIFREYNHGIWLIFDDMRRNEGCHILLNITYMSDWLQICISVMCRRAFRPSMIFLRMQETVHWYLTLRIEWKI